MPPFLTESLGYCKQKLPWFCFAFHPVCLLNLPKKSARTPCFLGILPLLLRFAWFLPSPEPASMETAADFVVSNA
jgi:hypothetical protein